MDHLHYSVGALAARAGRSCGRGLYPFTAGNCVNRLSYQVGSGKGALTGFGTQSVSRKLRGPTRPFVPMTASQSRRLCFSISCCSSIRSQPSSRAVPPASGDSLFRGRQIDGGLRQRGQLFVRLFFLLKRGLEKLCPLFVTDQFSCFARSRSGFRNKSSNAGARRMPAFQPTSP